MTQKELLEFISRIISSGHEENVGHSLFELQCILEKAGADEKAIELVTSLRLTQKEIAMLGKKKNGAPVTMEELSSFIREGRERIRREQRC